VSAVRLLLNGEELAVRGTKGNRDQGPCHYPCWHHKPAAPSGTAEAGEAQVETATAAGGIASAGGAPASTRAQARTVNATSSSASADYAHDTSISACGITCSLRQETSAPVLCRLLPYRGIPPYPCKNPCFVIICYADEGMIERRRFHTEVYIICTDGINAQRHSSDGKRRIQSGFILFPSIHFRNIS
jgi:hypothetical protein